MTPEAFIARWKNNDLTERAGAQAHFDDLCDLLGVEKPRDPENYCFERGAKKSGGGDGWADVWKRGCFGWENKKPGRDLKAALKQLTDYALHLENPPLLIVCDRENIEIHTAFTGYPDEVTRIRLEDLTDEAAREKLRWAFLTPEKLRPEKSTAAITLDVAGEFAALAEAMRHRGLDGQKVAHFLMQCLFCMFAEDEALLPKGIFTRLLEKAGEDAAKAVERIGRLFSAMREKGGVYGDDDIAWFNGGLFERIDAPELTAADLAALLRAAGKDWRGIDPTIFGTLFERGLDPKARAKLGAHYTDAATIEKLIAPLVSAPLSREWEEIKKEIEKLAPQFSHTQKGRRNNAMKQGQDLLNTFFMRLENFRVLDPACGSGNFLYLALHALREVEKRARVEAAEFGLQADLVMHTGPHNILGLEINEFAAELARVTVWIGDIQWSRRNGYPHAKNPVLKPLAGIARRDALLTPDNSEAAWPAADVIVGNPPFLGDKIMRSELGDEYVNVLRAAYQGRVPGGADFVTYWFEKARAQIEAGQLRAAGFVSTNSIRQKRNRVILERILQTAPIFEAWSDEPWINNGAAVRVSLVGFGKMPEHKPRLDGKEVSSIHADLTGGQNDSALDLTQARPLPANKDASFFGLCLAGKFKIDTATALAWLRDTGNPNQRPNSNVVRPIYNGSDITRRWAGNWVIDFAGMTLEDAADYLRPFEWVETQVKPVRISNREAVRAEKWWIHGRRRPELRAALRGQTHYIATPETAKHRFFVRFPVSVAPEHKLIVIPRSDTLILGLLSSRIHCLWAVQQGGRLGVGNDPVYNSSLCFETFPFPEGFAVRGDAVPEGGTWRVIADAARQLAQWRENWLNPSDWIVSEITPEEAAAGFPPRIKPKPPNAAEWKKRTLTNLYNENPPALRLRHETLDAAVAAAYGWTDYTPEMPDEEILRRLLALNQGSGIRDQMRAISVFRAARRVPADP